MNANFNFDQIYMERALYLAEKGLLSTSPNPRVGCVLTLDNEIIGEGFHEKAGLPHAEINALNNCVKKGNNPKGATAYVTLEPCAHFGKTPPCAEALIHAGICRVVCAMEDPNPQVSGKGFAKLREAKIEVKIGVLQAEAANLNRGFILRMSQNRPFIRLKIAASLDGKSALNNGQSQWITGDPARQNGHAWRARACAILSGINTVLADDPQFNVRLTSVSLDTFGSSWNSSFTDDEKFSITRQPKKIIVDSQLRLASLPKTAKIFAGAPLIVATTSEDAPKINAIEKLGGQVWQIPNANHQVDLRVLMQKLAESGVNELHVEAGAILNAALLEANLVDEILVYIAPTILGNNARGLFALPEKIVLPGNQFRIVDIQKLGEDFLVRAQNKSPR